MNKYSYNGLKRVTKATAKRLYMQGKTIMVCACKMRPDNMWQPAIPFSCHLPKDNDNSMYGNVASRFEKRMNEFQYYNCDYERGYYPAYYVQEVI